MKMLKIETARLNNKNNQEENKINNYTVYI